MDTGERKLLLSYSIGNLIVPISIVASTPILVHFLGYEGIGNLTLVTLPIPLMTSLFSWGLPEAISIVATQEKLEPLTMIKLLKRQLAYTSFTLIAVVSYLNFVLSEHLINPFITIFSCISVITVQGVNFIRAVAIGQGRFNLVTKEKIFTSIFRLAVFGIFGILNLINLTTAIILTLIIPGFGFFSYKKSLKLIFTRNIFHLLFKVENKETRQFEIARQIFFGLLLGMLLTKVDQLYLMNQVPQYQLGLYVIAVTLSDGVSLVTYSIRDIYTRRQGKSATLQELRKTSIQVAYATLFLSCILLVFIKLFGYDLYGEEIDSVFPILVLLMTNVIISSPGALAGASLLMSENGKYRNFAILFGIFFNILLLPLLVPEFGVKGAACAKLIGSAVATIFVLKKAFEILSKNSKADSDLL